MSPIRNRITGSTLIEVMVAVVVLSIGLLGLALLQLHSLQANTDAYLRTQASMFAYEIIDRMRANPTATGTGAYHVPDTTAADIKKSAYTGCKNSSCKCNTVGTTCDTDTLATYDLGKWYEEQVPILPAAAERSTITKNGNQHMIVIRWTERELPMSQTWMVEL